MKLPDIIAGIVGLLLCILIFYLTAGFPEDQVVRAGPAFFPRFLAAGLGIFSAILLLTAIARKHRVAHNPGFSLRDKGIQRSIVSAGVTIIYCFLFEYLGFITCSILYLITLMLLLRDRQYVQITVTAVAVTLSVFFIFKVLLNITLPPGTLYGF